MNTSPYLLRPSRLHASIFLFCLLLNSGNVEPNPGPLTNSPSVSFGSLNVRSAVHKAALIHDLIADQHLDIVALQETWITADSPPAVKADVAPDGYGVLHVHRVAVRGGPTRGGGLALIHNETISARHVALPISCSPTTFEIQLVALGSTSPPTVIMNIYRPPSSSVPVFLDKLAELLTAFGSQTPGKLLLCGDMNCPGPECSHINEDLVSLLDTFGLFQHVHEPTRGRNLLDIVATDHVASISDLLVDDSGLISDH